MSVSSRPPAWSCSRPTTSAPGRAWPTASSCRQSRADRHRPRHPRAARRGPELAGHPACKSAYSRRACGVTVTTSASSGAPRPARTRIGTAGVAVGLAMALVLALHIFGGSSSDGSASVPVSVSIDVRHPGARVPREFLGLSFELASLPQIARYASSGDFASMLRSLGAGVLRFGGASADTRVAWTDVATPRPAWASFALRAGDLRHLRKLASESGWQILLTIGLAHYCLLYTSPSPRDRQKSRMPSS